MHVTDGFYSFADGVWLDSTPVRHLGLRLRATMTVLRLTDGTLLLHSPITMTAARRASVDALGTVTHLYAPNLYHHVSIGEWAAAYPHARLHAPAGLSTKRPDLKIDRRHGAPGETAFNGILDEIPIHGFRLEESVLFYQPARVLVVADLVHNIGTSEHAWTKFYARIMGFHERVALSRAIRWMGFSDRTLARRSVDQVLGCAFDRIVVGHGAPLVHDARSALSEAYAWLH